MLRPIKYLVISLAGMAVIASLSVVQAKTKIKANLVADTTQIQQNPQTETAPTNNIENNSNPVSSEPAEQKPAEIQSPLTSPSDTTTHNHQPATAPTPTPAPKATAPVVNNTTSNAQTGSQKSTQPNTVISKSGQAINMSSATNFNTSSMTNIRAAADADTSCITGGFETQFICLINNYRASLGLHTLVEDGSLDRVGQGYATEMNTTKNFSHTDANGATFLDRCKAAGTTCWAENLAFGFTSPQTLFQMWKASPGHNANMVNPGYRSMGLGVSGAYAALYLR